MSVPQWASRPSSSKGPRTVPVDLLLLIIRNIESITPDQADLNSGTRNCISTQ